MSAAAFTKLIGLLGKKETLSAMKGFKKTTDAFKKAGDRANGIKSTLEQLGGSPIVAIFKMIIDKFKAGTTEAQMNLFKELMEFLDSPAGVLAIASMIEALNFIINHAANLIYLMDSIIDLITTKIIDFVDIDPLDIDHDYIPGLDDPPDTVVDPITTPDGGISEDLR